MTYSKNLISLKAFLDSTNINIINIIEFCNLKHTEDWKIWIDNYNNKLIINDKKDFFIKINTDIDIQYMNTNDLYFKSHIRNLIKNGKFSLISIFSESYYIWLLDNNDKLRLYLYVGDIFVGSQPVLLSSPDTLKKIIRNLSVENFREIFHITEPTSKQEATKSWAAKLPIDETLLTLLPEVIKKDFKFNVER